MSKQNYISAGLLLITLTAAVLFVPQHALAGYAAGVKPMHIFAGAEVYFGGATQPAGTCDYYSRHFRFDATTVAGKNMYMMLLTAKALGKNVDVWYSDSTATGTNPTNGCTTGAMAVPVNIGLSDQ